MPENTARPNATQNLSDDDQMTSMAAGAALLGYGLGSRKPWALLAGTIGAALIYRGWTRHCPLFERLEIDKSNSDPTPTTSTVTVEATPEECYRLWRDVERAPEFMTYVTHVEVIDERRSRWTAKPMGERTVTWVAEIVEDVENERIRWQTEHGAPVAMQGSAEFTEARGGRGTVVRSQVALGEHGDGLMNRAARPLAKLKMRADLRQFRQLVEAGEKASVEGQPSGREALPEPESGPPALEVRQTPPTTYLKDVDAFKTSTKDASDPITSAQE